MDGKHDKDIEEYLKKAGIRPIAYEAQEEDNKRKRKRRKRTEGQELSYVQRLLADTNPDLAGGSGGGDGGDGFGGDGGDD